jgi:hypothetical protein
MIYDLSSESDRLRLKIYSDKLTRKGALVELKEVTRRSLGQNNYLHLTIGWFGNNFGYTMDEAKLLYKYLNKDLYFYEKDGNTFYRSSSSLTKDELKQSIDRFRDYSASLDFYLPSSEDQVYLKAIYVELKNQNYMR